ncbi:MAG: YlmC/YmxH family sporulation protein [Clostridiales bacterium]|nr:YlmC/YmxH family sporulation protein [Clostridiales bacterium]
MEATFLELRCKEVVNVLDGRRLGHITDIVFDLSCARVLGFILPGEKTGWNIFKPCDQLFVPYNCVKRIGEDAILIELHSQGVPTNPYVLGNK